MFRRSRRGFTLERLEDRTVPAADFWAVGSDPGLPGEARLLDETGGERSRVTPFGSAYTGGVNVAVGDVTGDGFPDLIAAARSGGPRVRVFDGVTGDPIAGPLADFFAFDPSFTGGVNVAAADVNRDGYADLLTGAGVGGGPQVRVLDGRTGAELRNFFAYDPAFRGGVNVAAADLDGDDRADLVTGTGPGGGPHVQVFNSADLLPTAGQLPTAQPAARTSFFAYSPDFRGGVNVAAGESGDGSAARIVTGAGAGGAPHVRAFDLTGTPLGGGVFAGDPNLRNGVRVAVRYKSGRPGPIVSAATQVGVKDLDGSTLAPLGDATHVGSPVEVGGSAVKAGDAVQQWAGLVIQTIWRESTPPTRAARALAIVGAAMFDAVNTILGGAQPYLTGVSLPPVAAPQSRADEAAAAAAAAAAGTLTYLFPDRKAIFDAALIGSLAQLADPVARTSGSAIGNAVANAMIAWRSTDGSDKTVPYTPAGDPGDYQLTPPKFAQPLDPEWPQVTPFAMTRGDQFRPGPPPALTSPEYAAAFDEVKAIGGTTSTTRTPEQTLIAHFWADVPGVSVTPPGHWFEIALRLSKEKGLTLAENARLFGLLGIALADASIVSWDAKNFYDFWRPVTAIPAAGTDGNPDTAADPAWTPLWATPNFQSYTSGHSSFSGAAATVLDAVFGPNTSFVTSSDDMPGVVREFGSFQQAAEEAGQSRVYGGIHFQFDNQAGLASGRALGQYVVANVLKPT